ncbi:MAG: hypothetical protein RL033_3642, partial [Pseudomonadota bacterium]
MDVPLPRARRRKLTRSRYVWAAAVALSMAVAAGFVARLESRLKSVERAGIWTGKVE